MNAAQGVVVLVSPEDEGEIVRAIDASASLKVVRRCADLAEARAAIRARVAALAVLDASDPDVDAITVDELHRCGAGVVLVADPREAGALGALGADGVTIRGAASSVVDSLLVLTRTGAGSADAQDLPLPPPPPRSAGDEEEIRLLERALAARAPAPSEDPPAVADRRGRVLAVWGTTGAPGRSTIALGLAHALSTTSDVLLVDADTKDPSIAHMSGMPVDASGLAALARRAVRAGLDAPGLRDCLVERSPGPSLLTGLSSPHRWREAGPAAVAAILEACRPEFDWIIVDVSALGPEPLPDEVRHQGSQEDVCAAVLRSAEEILCVARADVIGVNRLSFAVEWIEENLPGSSPRIVVNRVGAPGLGPRPHNALDAALSSIVPGSEVHLVPDDEAVARSLLEGRSVVAASPKSPAARAIGALAEELARAVGEDVEH